MQRRCSVLHLLSSSPLEHLIVLPGEFFGLETVVLILVNTEKSDMPAGWDQPFWPKDATILLHLKLYCHLFVSAMARNALNMTDAP